MREVVEHLGASRLVTLIGGGGVGKTRLALAAAQEVADGLLGGAVFVELAPLTDASLVSRHVAAALGLREEASGASQDLIEALAGRLSVNPMLLVLDNCEHLIEATAALAQALLEACPELRVLATSRQRLGVTGEVAWRVPSLPFPNPGEGSRVEGRGSRADGRRTVPSPSTLDPRPSTLLEYPAVRLFVERAGAARPGFRLGGAEDAVAVARICQQLDGIPLAIELAAARVTVLTVAQIAARLDDRFRLLAGGRPGALPRHRTLRALIDWSYDLLAEGERALLRRLSVFAGSWSLEGAEAVCSGVQVFRCSGVQEETDPSDLNARTPERLNALSPDDVLDLLAALEEKSLVVAEEREGVFRYRMLETVREYARERLAASGELAHVRNRHRDWCLQLAEQTHASSGRPEQQVWLRRLEVEIDNLRAALAWCQEQAAADAESDGAEAGLRLAVGVGWLWQARGYLTEGLQWLEGLLARGRAVPAPVRARALDRAAHLARGGGDRERARTFLQAARQAYEEALTLARRERSRSDVARTLADLAYVTFDDHDLEAAWNYCVEARQNLEELGDLVQLAVTLMVMAGVARDRGDRRTARTLLEEQVAICRKLGDTHTLIHALGGLGHLERDEGDYERARAFYRESLLLRRELGHLYALAQSLEDLAVLAGREGHAERAIRLLGAAEAFCETLGARPPVAIVAEYERTVAEGRAALGEAAFAVAWAEGRAMPLEDAVAYALGE